jgi:predicted AAA+ superfamily ATPase
MISLTLDISIRFNLFNIYAQSVYANQYLSGDQINFLNVLSEVYGIEHKEYVLSLKGLYTYVKLSIEDLKEKIVIARQIVNELKKSDLTYPTKMRLQLRKVYNDRIGIYN